MLKKNLITIVLLFLVILPSQLSATEKNTKELNEANETIGLQQVELWQIKAELKTSLGMIKIQKEIIKYHEKDKFNLFLTNCLLIIIIGSMATH